MARYHGRTYPRFVQARTGGGAPRQLIRPLAQLQEPEQEEPMHRYTFPIPQPAQAAPLSGETAATLTQLLERQIAQEQLLADLLEAVKALTSALLSRTAQG